MNRLPIAIDLFSGCGGFSTGLLDAGIKVVAGFDNESRAIEVYNYNHNYRGAKGHVVDLGLLSGQDLLDKAGVKDVDLIVGGPPCQAFSIIGKRRGFEDKRGRLINDFVRLISEIQPQAFILENVANLARFNNGEVVQSMVKDFNSLGYLIKYQVLPVAFYGVPQLRKRLFMIGITGVSDFKFPPEPTHEIKNNQSEWVLLDGKKPFLSTKEAIGDLPDVDTLEGQKIPNHEPTVHSVSMLATFSSLAPGSRDPKSHHDRLHPDRLAYTLRAGSGNFSPLRPVHYEFDRVITVRESARIQGFSDEFIWPDSIPRLQQYRQVGNAVPPPVVTEIAKEIANAIGWELQPDSFCGDPLSRISPWTKTPEQRKDERMRRIRGASLGA